MIHFNTLHLDLWENQECWDMQNVNLRLRSMSMAVNHYARETADSTEEHRWGENVVVQPTLMIRGLNLDIKGFATSLFNLHSGLNPSYCISSLFSIAAHDASCTKSTSLTHWFYTHKHILLFTWEVKYRTFTVHMDVSRSHLLYVGSIVHPNASVNHCNEYGPVIQMMQYLKDFNWVTLHYLVASEMMHRKHSKKGKIFACISVEQMEKKTAYLWPKGKEFLLPSQCVFLFILLESCRFFCCRTFTKIWAKELTVYIPDNQTTFCSI